MDEKQLDLIIFDTIPDLLPSESKAAAHAIAERLREGVAWEGEGTIEQRDTGWCYVVLGSATDSDLQALMLNYPQDVEDGQRVRVTVRREEP